MVMTCIVYIIYHYSASSDEDEFCSRQEFPTGERCVYLLVLY